MAAINREKVDQLRTETFSWKLIVGEDLKVIDRTLLRWRNSNGYVDLNFIEGLLDRASSESDVCLYEKGERVRAMSS